MQTLFGIFFFLCLLAFLVALISPQLLNKLLKNDWPKKKLAGNLGLAAFVCFILIGVFGPDQPRDQLDNNQTVANQQNQNTTPGEVRDEAVEIQPQHSDSQPSPNNQTNSALTENTYTVVNVVDGDTIDVKLGSGVKRVRLIGIDTPETVEPGKPVQCFGHEASNKLKSLISGKVVTLEADSSQDNTDKYDRLLRYVFLNGQNINQQMILEGYAREYTYQKPYQYQKEFKQAESQAKAAKKGLWADNACNTNPTPTTTPPVNNAPPKSSGTNSQSPIILDGIDRDCGDFKTHAEAQSYFEAGGGSPTYNFDRLDSDSDGLACEGLP